MSGKHFELLPKNNPENNAVWEKLLNHVVCTGARNNYPVNTWSIHLLRCQGIPL